MLGDPGDHGPADTSVSRAADPPILKAPARPAWQPTTMKAAATPATPADAPSLRGERPPAAAAA